MKVCPGSIENRGLMPFALNNVGATEDLYPEDAERLKETLNVVQLRYLAKVK